MFLKGKVRGDYLLTLAYDDSTQQGAYFRLHIKFDEDLFKRNNPSKNKRLTARTAL
ncbi:MULTISPECIES: hypothetical protein [Psychrobacter]|uniref:hypothetical protein n=1 Tax=Psychrobacter TaxID=497 RepID=UPI0019195348|nr:MULTISPECIES: hypothetical protein [Psychrobacter]